MSRFARNRRVFYLEEPIVEDVDSYLRLKTCPDTGVHVLTPVVSSRLKGEGMADLVAELVKSGLVENAITDCISWYYTPMAMGLDSFLPSRLTVYDCMDELSAFAGAPPAMRENEERLFRRADLVFTGGASLYESKRNQHSSVYLFPSSVDIQHFYRARHITEEPGDQQGIPHPRLGYAGVIDERMDLELIRRIANSHPDWQLVLIGPVTKVDPDLLPQASNIHYLGMKQYADLPGYLSGWDVAMLPFALNESTKFISPTKTPEYLAAGLPVVSTAIRDVVKPYGELGFVRIGHDANEFTRAIEAQLASPMSKETKVRIDEFLSQSSWDKTWSEMEALINSKILGKNSSPSGDGQKFTTTLNSVPERVSHV